MELIPFLSTAALILDIIFVFTILFIERGDPSRTLTWVMILLLLPLVGAPLYIFFHQNHRRKSRKFARKEEVDTKLRKLFLGRTKPREKGISATAQVEEQYHGLARMISREDPHAIITTGNKVTLFIEGEDTFASMRRDLQEAHHHIHFQFYQVNNDRLGQEFLQMLADKAKGGVEVRLLLDGLGSRKISPLAPRLRENGVQLVFFYPGIYHYNYRNHRKIVVIDGKVGYCGGFNVGDEYIGKGPLGHWRDAETRIAGPQVYELQLRFIQDWNYSSDEQIGFDPAYFPVMEPEGNSPGQEVSSGPDTTHERIKETYLKMISLARKTCYIQTPYFIPDISLKEVLIIAAESGVDVRLMIPSKPDHPFVYWATQSFCADLLEAGVRTYLYNRGFLHAKTIVIDGKIGSVGSANFDTRSFRLNFETNVIIYDALFAEGMKGAFERDLSSCTELTQEIYDRRSLIVRIKEPFARLLFPLV